MNIRHAYLMCAAEALSALSDSSLPIAVTAVCSVMFWLFQVRNAFAATGFGWANWVTSLRLFALIVLALLFDSRQPMAAAWLAAGIFCLDGLDGLLARRTQTESNIGALYDAETDASFSMLLTWGVFQLDRAAAWVLVGGLLRYAYAISLHLLRVRDRHAPRTRLGRYVFGLSVSGYALSLWPFSGPIAMALSAAATGLLCYSFARSFYWSFFRTD